jgi:hypothetical protein
LLVSCFRNALVQVLLGLFGRFLLRHELTHRFIRPSPSPLAVPPSGVRLASLCSASAVRRTHSSHCSRANAVTSLKHTSRLEKIHTTQPRRFISWFRLSGPLVVQIRHLCDPRKKGRRALLDVLDHLLMRLPRHRSASSSSVARKVSFLLWVL